MLYSGKVRNGKAFGGGALLLVAGLMLWGFFRSGLNPWAPATLIAVLIAVVIPAAAGSYLLAIALGAGRRIAQRQEDLRLQTLEAEILRLATRKGGKLTSVEVTAELAVDKASADKALDALAVRELAEMELTDAGNLVYSFRNLENLPGQKERAKRILDA